MYATFIFAYNFNNLPWRFAAYSPITVKASARTTALAAAGGSCPERLNTSKDAKILSNPSMTWINKPVEKTEIQTAN
jgi:hypothetical protein